MPFVKGMNIVQLRLLQTATDYCIRLTCPHPQNTSSCSYFLSVYTFKLCFMFIRLIHKHTTGCSIWASDWCLQPKILYGNTQFIAVKCTKKNSFPTTWCIIKCCVGIQQPVLVYSGKHTKLNHINNIPDFLKIKFPQATEPLFSKSGVAPLSPLHPC